MIGIFVKRLYRYIKENIAQSIGLMLLTMIIVAIVVTFVSTSYTIIDGRKKNSTYENVEDGYFSLLIPMSDESKSQLEQNYNLQIESIFNYDVVEGNRIYRIFKNRKSIDRLVLKEGKEPTSESEVVLDQLFASTNGYNVGDRITFSNREFTICGLGSISDYIVQLNKMSDVSADNENFSWIIVSDSCYESLLSQYSYQQDYNYSFKFNDEKDYEKLREAVGAININYDEYALTHTYFHEYVQENIDLFSEQRKNSGKTPLDIDSLITNMGDTINGAKQDIADISQSLDNTYTQVSNNQSISQVDKQALVQIIATFSDEITSGVEDINGYLSTLKESCLYTYLPLNYQSYLTIVSKGIANVENHIALIEKYKNNIESDSALSYSIILTNIEKLTKNISTLDIEVEQFDSYFNEVSNYAKIDDFNSYENVDSEIKIILRFAFSNATSLISSKDNRRMNNDLDYAYLYRDVSLIIGSIFIVLLAIVFALVTRHKISSESTIIGTQYAMGVSKSMLMMFYIFPSLVISVVGGIFGLLAGYSKPLMNLSLFAFHVGNSFPFYEHAKPLIMVGYAIGMPLLISLIVNLLVLNRTFKKTTLQLLRGEEQKKKNTKIDLSKLNYSTKFGIRNLFNEKGIAVVVFVTILIATVSLMMGINTRYLISNNVEAIEDLSYNYTYFMKYPMSEIECEGEKVYIETMTTKGYGKTVDVSIIGVGDNGEFYSNINVESDSAECVINRALSTKTGLKVGDRVVLEDSVKSTSFSFNITEIVDDGASLNLYLDIDYMRTLFKQNSKYYNTILSANKLDIDNELIYSIQNKQNAIGCYKNEMKAVTPFVLFSIIGSVFLFLVTSYLVLSTMLDRNRKGISILRVVGYEEKEIHKMYISGIILIAIISTLLAIPIAKIIADYFCVFIYYRVQIGMFFSISIYVYFVLFIIAVIMLLAIVKILFYKLKRIEYTAILKDVV